jgi:hydrogenase maturation protease
MATLTGIPMRTRIIGLGNTVLRDDGVGVYAVREIARRLTKEGFASTADIIETEVAGFALLELMTGWERIILVDSIQFDDLTPGTIVQLNPQDLRTSLRIRSIHEIDLPTVLELGRQLDLPMPQEIMIYGIQAEDATTFGEFLTPAVQVAMNQTVSRVLNML